MLRKNKLDKIKVIQAHYSEKSKNAWYDCITIDCKNGAEEDQTRIELSNLVESHEHVVGVVSTAQNPNNVWTKVRRAIEHNAKINTPMFYYLLNRIED